MSTITPVSIRWDDTDRPPPGSMSLTTQLTDNATDDTITGETGAEAFTFPEFCIVDGPSAYVTVLADFGAVVDLSGHAWRTTARARWSVVSILAYCQAQSMHGEPEPVASPPSGGFTIETSTDGTTWTVRAAGALTPNAPSLETRNGTFGGSVTARYVRVVYTSATEEIAGHGTLQANVQVTDLRLSGDTIPMPPTPPAAPVIAEEHTCPAGQAVIGTDTYPVPISWPVVTGATGYRVYRGGVLIGDVGALWFVDTGRALAVTYSYVVRAYNGVGESGDSNTVSVVCCSPPGAPSVALRRCCAKHTIRVTWAAPGTGYLPITLYTLTRDGATIYQGASLCFLDDGTIAPPDGVPLLDDFRAYHYTLTATSACGTGPATAITARALWSRRSPCSGATDYTRRSGRCNCS